ncbi:hypothetical protein ISS08_01350 [Candidatus Pacearchaeota archaeon]|nr:hypothetical protein [Candidatus Pacearchaeota archaeon]
MRKKLIPFKKIIFLESKIKQSNVFEKMNSKKKIFNSKLIDKGFYDGSLKSVDFFKIKNKNLEIGLGKTSFFDMLFLKEIGKKLSPSLAVNAIIEVEGHIIFIRRDENVYSSGNKIDFPAGLVPKDKTPLKRLKNRIKEDLGLEESKIVLERLIPCAIDTDDCSFNLFFKMNYKGNKKEIEDFFEKNFETKKPFLVKKDKISTFFKKNDKPIFFEILKYI